ncbi:MAG: hypoxanthine phosphoribosyltransferase [Christensenellales bacterium]|jgi:hypoxanthine phosphoribosyltransferase
MNETHPDISRILIPSDRLAARVRELGAQITADYHDRSLCLIAILRGAVIFTADLMRTIDRPLTVDFMAVSSYGAGTVTTGAVRILKDLNADIAGLHVLIVEDVLDTGLTLRYLKENLLQRNPASLRICVMFDKPERRRVDIRADYVGFTIPDAFVVGYGLDYNERYRNLPYVGVLDPRVYALGQSADAAARRL